MVKLFISNGQIIYKGKNGQLTLSGHGVWIWKTGNNDDKRWWGDEPPFYTINSSDGYGITEHRESPHGQQVIF